MGFNPRFNLGVLLLLFIPTLTISTLLHAPSPAPPSKPTVYELLPEFGLPRGLLPDCVKSYNITKDDNFEVVLDRPCYVQFESLVYYAEKITGKLNIGSITNLEGIEVKRFWFWFNVNEIRVDLPPSDSIYFQIGYINRKLDVSQFETIHSCRDKELLSNGGSLRQVLQLPAPVNDVQMLVTE